MPKEVVDAGAANWKNANGTGPFMLADFVQGNSNTYVKNPIYWDKEKINGAEYKLPFVDKLVYRTIKDEATFVTALRTGKLDILESIRWQNVEQLKKSAPQLQWSKWLNMSGTFLAMRVDTKPFDDIRVRRALNMAINKQEIVSAYYNGNAELFAYPQHPDYTGYFEPLEAMPDSVKELFTYDPAKAKKLLAEAGLPNGFTFKVQVCSCNPDHMDLLPLIAAYLEKIDVKIEIQPMEYGAFLSAMTSKTNTAGYFMNNGHTNPTTTIRKSFIFGQVWNPSQYNDPEYEKQMNAVYLERDEVKRQEMLEADDARDPGQGPLHLAADAAHLHGVVAVGEKLQRRTARRRRSSWPDLCAHLGRPGPRRRRWASDGAGPTSAGYAPPAGPINMAQPLLQVRNLTTRFNTERGRLTAVDQVSFDVECRRDSCHRRRVRLGQERHGALHHAPHSLAAGAHRQRRGDLRGPGSLQARRRRHPRHSRQQDRHDLPGADVVAQPRPHSGHAGGRAGQPASQRDRGPRRWIMPRNCWAGCAFPMRPAGLRRTRTSIPAACASGS